MSGPWERRWHPLLDEWVVISSSSAARPWSGARSSGTLNPPPRHDPSCYLCPGVTRASGNVNVQYEGPYAFDNDFPTFAASAPTPVDAITDEPNEHALRADPFSITAAAAGQCRVLCWSDRHDTTLAELPTESMADISKLWQTEFRQLKANPAVKQALMFENKGVEIGVSNLHPHGQVYGLPFVSSHAQRMRLAQSRYANAPALVEDSSSDKSNDNPNGKDNPNDNPEDNRENSKNVKHSEDKHNHGRNHRKGNPHTRSLLIDMLNHASVKDTLIIERANYWTVLVPFAARFAYETWIVPHTHIPDLNALSDEILFELGEVYQRQAQRYDALFKRQSPNITHFHNAPCDNHPDNAHWCFHMAFQPPLREPDKLKYLGGFESAAGNITNPVQPEIAATRLRELGI